MCARAHFYSITVPAMKSALSSRLGNTSLSKTLVGEKCPRISTRENIAIIARLAAGLRQKHRAMRQAWKKETMRKQRTAIRPPGLMVPRLGSNSLYPAQVVVKRIAIMNKVIA